MTKSQIPQGVADEVKRDISRASAAILTAIDMAIESDESRTRVRRTVLDAHELLLRRLLMDLGNGEL